MTFCSSFWCLWPHFEKQFNRNGRSDWQLCVMRRHPRDAMQQICLLGTVQDNLKTRLTLKYSTVCIALLRKDFFMFL